MCACRAVKPDGTQPVFNTTEYYDYSGVCVVRRRGGAGGEEGANTERAACMPQACLPPACLHPCLFVPAYQRLPVRICARARPPSHRLSRCSHPCPLSDTSLVSHGSHVAGIVGAVGNNGYGLTGVAWDVSLWICKATSAPNANGISYLYGSATLDCYSLCNQVGRGGSGPGAGAGAGATLNSAVWHVTGSPGVVLSPAMCMPGVVAGQWWPAMHLSHAPHRS